MKKILLFIVVITLLTGCGKSSRPGGELTGVNAVAWNEPAPYGMVLIKQGSFSMGPSESDSLWGIDKAQKEVSFSSFWMDETEITNAKYRQFVYWVRDSIIRERLADPSFGGNDLFKIQEDALGEPIKPYLNWARPIPWKKPNEDELRAIESVYYIHPITGEKRLDEKQMNFRYEWFDQTSASLRKYNLDPALRNRNTDIPANPDEVIMISKDTAYINEDGQIINETITRPLTGLHDFLHTRIVNIYPDETCWVNDFNNSYNEPYVRMYFSHPGYNDYPVVGVSWEQATAFCVWRTAYMKQTLNLKAGQIIEPFRLPSEGEWEYAARAGKNDRKFPWMQEGMQSTKGCFLGNYKPDKGNYTKDGNLITSRVGSYSPNEFGLYDMAGNVAEWTSTSYSESGPSLMSDLNPDFRYDAAKEDPYSMKRKVVRGGSWKDVGTFIRSDMRSAEFQNETRSYIGFRCVRTHLGFGKK
ncbi:MAG: SUMF1/EgtB/PvdO family nonheme iron enzyme [Bacteroidales bacterium]|nr:SUMF1/EgtB/PvdO family nonheme iron enzyme [Bacteroidales bacterium]